MDLKQFNISMPNRTVLQCSLAALASVLLLSWLRVRPLCVLCLALLGFWYYKTRCNLRIIPPPELEKKFQAFTQLARDTRSNNPAMFCAIATGCLGALAVLGHIFSGSTVVIMGLIAAAIISSKYNFKIIRIEPKDFEWASKMGYDNDDEFMPEVNADNLCVLERASDLALLTTPNGEGDDDKSEEIPSDLLPKQQIPEVGDHSSDEEDLVPVDLKSEKSKIAKAGSKELIEFKKGHFKRDSSLSSTPSSSDESLSRGLQFPDHTAVDGAPAVLQLPSSESPANGTSLEGRGSKLLPSIVSGIVQWSMGGTGTASGSGDPAEGTATLVTSQAAKVAPGVHQRRRIAQLDSSDESDFEILENEDFK